jgi:uncharacterized Zn finger protein
MSYFFHPSDEINTKGHFAVGFVWSVAGSKNNLYNVVMADRGFSCTCPAFKKCKHIKSVEDGFCKPYTM